MPRCARQVTLLNLSLMDLLPVLPQRIGLRARWMSRLDRMVLAVAHFAALTISVFHMTCQPDVTLHALARSGQRSATHADA
ncbi:MAG: hypothetical protein Q8J92_13605 [Parvibaculum sp.]|nr:hypothetical protein [Parvibaculum sp.]MDZ4369509.1 hypothetical protein [Afipia sp.]